jgi:hypothetical protein
MAANPDPLVRVIADLRRLAEERDHARFIADQLGKEKRQLAADLDAARAELERRRGYIDMPYVDGLEAALRKANADKAELLAVLERAVNARASYRKGYYTTRPPYLSATDYHDDAFRAVIAKHSA